MAIGGIYRISQTPQIDRLITSLPGEIREFFLEKYIMRYAVLEAKEQVYILKNLA